jgi:hypothetical protein
MSEKSTAIVGLGVVGLPLAMRLAQSGRRLILLDHDYVETANLSKQWFDHAHAGAAGDNGEQQGAAKVAAALELIQRHKPDAAVLVSAVDVRNLGVGFFIEEVDLVAACVDNRHAERYLARVANLCGLDYVRLALDGPSRIADVTFVSVPEDAAAPCGVCSYTDQDLRIINRRLRCGGEHHPEAGALTYSEHGSLAAAICVESLLRAEVAPPRRIRFQGAPLEPVLSTTRLVGNAECNLARAPWTHGPQVWHRWAGDPDPRLGDLVAAACDALSTTPDQVAAEADVPFCTERVCTKCGTTLGAGFRQYPPLQPKCDRCGGSIRDDAEPVSVRVAARMLGRCRERTLTELGAPAGLGLRFVAQAESYNVYIPDQSRRWAVGGQTLRKGEPGRALHSGHPAAVSESNRASRNGPHGRRGNGEQPAACRQRA